jgi:two-component system, LytTR family, response regulator
MTLRALLVDDERLARVVLRGLLHEHADVEVVAEAHSVDSAVAALIEHAPDLVFLDVQMPGGDGTRLFERTAVRGRVIFVTAYDHYAVRAFELNALDYLLKPVEPERLAQALDRARLAQGPLVPEEAQPPEGLHLDELLCLPHHGGMRFFRVREITRLSADGDYCIVHLAGGTRILSSSSLTDWENRLPEPFLRVHRSHVVHVEFVKRVVPAGSSFQVRLSDGESVPMSRRRGADFRELLSGGGRSGEN